MPQSDKHGEGQQGKGAAAASLVVAIAVTLGTLLITGALVLLATGGMAPAGARLGLAVAAALVVGLGLPLWLDHAMTRAYRKIDPQAASTRRQVVAIWNVLLAAVALLAFPVTTRRALVHHGHWLLEGTVDGSETGLGRRIGRLASHLPRSGVADEASAAPPTSAVPARASGRTPAVTAATAAPSVPAASAQPVAALPPVADHDLTPQEVFQLRADTVVVIATRQAVSATDPYYPLYRELGVKSVDGFGSGFVLEPTGLVVTNHHVVEGAETMQITLRTGRSFAEVEVLATDREHDLALVAVAGEGLPTAPLAPDDTVGPGARAIAIGAPLGLDYSVTDGIVSAVRDIQGTTFLQMQTTIAPGSSGGPLFDVRGRVMGVNTATRGAGLNLAVHGKYAGQLRQRERKPKKLARYEPGARIDELRVEGGDASSVERMELAEALRLLSVGVESCLDVAPAAPQLTVRFRHAPSGVPRPGDWETESNLDPRVLACLQTNLKLTGAMVALFMQQTFGAEIQAGKPVAVVVEVVGLRAAEQLDGAVGERSLTVRFAFNTPPR